MEEHQHRIREKVKIAVYFVYIMAAQHKEVLFVNGVLKGQSKDASSGDESFISIYILSRRS